MMFLLETTSLISFTLLTAKLGQIKLMKIYWEPYLSHACYNKQKIITSILMQTKNRKLAISFTKHYSNSRTYWVSIPKTSLPLKGSPLMTMRTMKTKTTRWVGVA